jgi:hypothetical protein
MSPVIAAGNKRVLTEIDMPDLPKADTAEHLRDLAQVSSLDLWSGRGGGGCCCVLGWMAP